MKGLLEKHFAKHYHSTKQVEVESRLEKGRFCCCDQKACTECEKSFPHIAAGCNRVVVFCETGDKAAEVLELESFLNNFNGLKALPSGQKCDLLMEGKDVIVLCDMTCSKAKYIAPFVMKDGTEKIGKRNSVKRQIENTISVLMDVPEIAAAIDMKNKRFALFAYREKPENNGDDFDKGVSKQMSSFNAIDICSFEESMYTDMNHGFLFTEVKYPNVFIL